MAAPMLSTAVPCSAHWVGSTLFSGIHISRTRGIATGVQGTSKRTVTAHLDSCCCCSRMHVGWQFIAADAGRN